MQPRHPIQHVVLIIKENHSFDNSFGSFPGVNGPNFRQHKIRPSVVILPMTMRHGCSARRRP